MNIDQITKKFIQGTRWNASFYTLRKISSTILTVILFKKLSTIEFSIWANLHSAIFLVLLWLDFGFKKSLPRYCPEFAKNKQSMKQFAKYIVLFQALAIAAILPIFIVTVSYLLTRSQITSKIHLLYLGCMLFAAEGLRSVMRLIYHSYFWQKQFNTLMSCLIIAKTTVNLIIIFSAYPIQKLLKLLLIAEISTSIIAAIISTIMLKYLYKDKNYPGNKILDFNKTMKDFAQHSGMMWVNNNLKSFTERNFMLLILTRILGPAQSNLFKLANDGALLFQRIVKKTIGTTDTSLLSHAQNLTGQGKVMHTAFTRLANKISSLCAPLLGILLIILINFKGRLFSNPFVFKTFVIITMFYLTESLLSPYERILEIKRRYLLLSISYSPYILMLLFGLFSFAKNSIISQLGLLGMIIIIHFFRLSSFLIMVYFVKQKYKIQFPLKNLIRMFSTSMAICLFASVALKVFLYWQAAVPFFHF